MHAVLDLSKLNFVDSLAFHSEGQEALPRVGMTSFGVAADLTFG